MVNRDAKGRFTAGNEWASKGGRARAKALPAERRKEIARLGFAAMVERHFAGDRQKATDWLTAKGVILLFIWREILLAIWHIRLVGVIPSERQNISQNISSGK